MKHSMNLFKMLSHYMSFHVVALVSIVGTTETDIFMKERVWSWHVSTGFTVLYKKGHIGRLRLATMNTIRNF